MHSVTPHRCSFRSASSSRTGPTGAPRCGWCAGLIQMVNCLYCFPPGLSSNVNISSTGARARGASQLFAVRDSRESPSGKRVAAQELGTGPRKRCQGELRGSRLCFLSDAGTTSQLAAGVSNRPRCAFVCLPFRCSKQYEKIQRARQAGEISGVTVLTVSHCPDTVDRKSVICQALIMICSMGRWLLSFEFRRRPPGRFVDPQAFARRPTNLMLVLSVIDAAKNEFGAAGDKDKRKTSHAAKGERTQSTTAAEPGDGATETDSESGKPEPPVDGGETAEEIGDRGRAQRQAASQGAERRIRRRRLAGTRRDTPGWRAWEAR